jgi:hypothetical protein
MEGASPCYQLFTRTLYAAADEAGTGHILAPGDIYDAFWMMGSHGAPFEGERLAIIMPDGSPWYNTTASNCPHGKPPGPHSCWTVTGTLPNITVRASIDTGHWHGFITNGVAEP